MIRLIVIIFSVLFQQEYMAYIPLAYSIEPKIGAEIEDPPEYWINRARPLKVNICAADVVQPDGSYDFFISDNLIRYFDVTYISVKCSPAQWVNAGQPICKLPKSQYWDEYAAYVQAIIDRYYPNKVGIWNEPDSPDSSYPQEYGCLGETGGTLYGQFVRYIHDHTSGAEIVLGDVTTPYNDFLQDAISGAAGHFDYVGLHCYSAFYYWYGLYNACGNRILHAETLTSKPVMLTETAVYPKAIDPNNPAHIAGYEAAQVQYWQWLEARNAETYWFTLCDNKWPLTVPGGTDLCNRPVYYEYSK